MNTIRHDDSSSCSSSGSDSELNCLTPVLAPSFTRYERISRGEEEQRERYRLATIAAEKARMESLLVRILSELLVYIPELGEFDLPHTIDITGMPNKIVEALTTYGPYCKPNGASIQNGPINRAQAIDKVYLSVKLDPWLPLLDAAKGRRRT